MVNFLKYDRESVYDMTLGEILDVIAHHHKFMDEQNKKMDKAKKGKNPNRTETTTRQETFSYGRVDEFGNPVSWNNG